MTFPLRRVLISVSNKNGIVELAVALTQMNCEILSTGGTAALLKQHQIPHIEVSEYTQFAEILEGRVKTLHPKIHAGILARNTQEDALVLANLNIPQIDAVIVNLYPFQQCIADPNHSLSEAIENIDIGGPTLIRAAAKNYSRVAVVVDPDDYPHFLKTQAKELDIRFALAQKAFAHTAAYDAAIAHYLGSINDGSQSEFPLTYHPIFYKQYDLRYGENPHQKAAFYSDTPDNHKSLQKAWYGKIPASIVQSSLLQGKPLSYNNIADADSAWQSLKDLDTNEPACVIVKHANACGAAIQRTLIDAYQSAYATDPLAAFGGIIALNKTLDAKTAQKILQTQFVEVLMVPQVEPLAWELIQQKPNIRLLVCPYFQQATQCHSSGWTFKKINGGLLVQSSDTPPALDLQNLTCVTERQPTEQEKQDLCFAWKVVKNIQSNAIVYARNQTTTGIGAGQMSRIDSVRIGLEKAQQSGIDLNHAVMASDAFFPFRDGIDKAAQAGITAIIQPGGSLRDQEVIAAANEFGLAMIFTGIRHFRH